MPLIACKVWLIWLLQSISLIPQTLAYSHFVKSNVEAISSAGPDLLSTRDGSGIEITNFPIVSDTAALLSTLVLSKSSSKRDEARNSGLRLRSSNRNITAVNGDILYASPILLTELLALLRATREDLATHFDQNAMTKIYQFNHMAWSFNVVVAKGTLRYSSISSIVKRFIRLTSSQSEGNITWTWAGCVFGGSEPIADVAMLPWNTDENPTFGDLNITTASLSLTPVKVMTISPNGVSNSTETISAQALDVYKTFLKPKRQASAIERAIIVKVFDTGLHLTLEIFENPDGVVARAVLGFLVIPISLALCKLALGLVADLVFGPLLGDELLGDDFGHTFYLDSGSYRLGQFCARFIIKATARDRDGRIIAFKPETLKAIANALLDPLLQAAGNLKNDIYAVGGRVMGPDAVNGTGETVALGDWGLMVEPAPERVHDEPQPARPDKS